MSVRIDYGGVAVGAKENFAPDIADKADFVNLSELQEEGLDFPNYGNPCELYSVLLDGNALPFPSDTDSENLGWWSNQLSNENGEFVVPIVATFLSEEFYTSSGITLTFDTNNNIYPTEINIKWYRDDELLSNVDFFPNDAFCFCNNKVENYNKIILTISSLNMPFNRLKLRTIDYGLKISFYRDELKNVKIIQEIDLLSTKIAINTCDFTLESKRSIDFSFQERQPISIYFNNKLRATSFVDKAIRKGRSTWNVQTEDYIAIMESVPFYGGIYNNVSATSLLEDIFDTAQASYEIESTFEDSKVTGYIPYTNCREALMQVAFAIGGVVDTTNSGKISIFSPKENISQKISLDRIMQGQNFTEQTRMTAVEITAHTYGKTEETVTAYDATEGGAGANLFVAFTEPLHSLSIINGVILSYGDNYAIITAGSGCLLTGKKYEHKETKKIISNPLIFSTDKKNIISIKNATLVSPSNVDKVAERCYNYYINNEVVKLKIVEGKHEEKISTSYYGISFYGTKKYSQKEIVYDSSTAVGDKIECETEYLGEIQKTIVKQTYNLNGGIIIKDTELR